MVMFAGHCGYVPYDRCLVFIGHHDDHLLECAAPPLEAKWGDTDLEWILLEACGSLTYDVPTGSGSQNKTAGYWATALQGSDIICGAVTDMFSHEDDDNGYHVARRLIGAEGGTVHTVMSAWFLGCDVHQPPPVKLAVISENSGCLLDYIWGQGSGPNYPDGPPVDNQYSWVRYTCQ